MAGDLVLHFRALTRFTQCWRSFLNILKVLQRCAKVVKPGSKQFVWRLYTSGALLSKMRSGELLRASGWVIWGAGPMTSGSYVVGGEGREAEMLQCPCFSFKGK